MTVCVVTTPNIKRKCLPHLIDATRIIIGMSPEERRNTNIPQSSLQQYYTNSFPPSSARPPPSHRPPPSPFSSSRRPTSSSPPPSSPLLLLLLVRLFTLPQSRTYTPRDLQAKYPWVRCL